MDRVMWEDHLALAERHVALGAEHVAHQHQIIADLERSGHDATDARLFLAQLQDLQKLHLAHRDRLLKELGA